MPLETGRRDFLKLSGASALGSRWPLAGGGAAPAQPAPAQAQAPQLALIVLEFSPQKFAFAAAHGYEGVVLHVGHLLHPDRVSSRQIDAVRAAARDTGARLISLEYMWDINHIDPNAVKRRQAQQRFVRYLELAHELGCRFAGTFSGGIPGATIDRQVKEFAAVMNEVYLPVCEKLDLRIGWENYPSPQNFATVPETWEKIFALVPNPRLGLEFDPSHFVRQFIDPIAAAWQFRQRIYAAHAKDTEITEPVLQQVGIHGRGWWRYRIPGQGRVDWPAFITVLLQAGFTGGIAVEQEDPFWNRGHSHEGPTFSPSRQDGFILGSRFLRMYLPGRRAPAGD